MKKIEIMDLFINEVDYALGVLTRKDKKNISSDDSMDKSNQKKSINVMRVNHMGEVCAQALYRGQAFTTRDKEIREKLYEMCHEEKNHLDLCRERLDELGGNSSILNTAWYTSSFLLGCIAGATSKKWGLGFIEETERQVGAHLDEYIEKLLTKLQLYDKKNNIIKSLSGGMKRRVLIAKALSHNPQILFLDEPTAGVDVELRKDMWSIIKELKNEHRTLLSTLPYHHFHLTFLEK